MPSGRNELDFHFRLLLNTIEEKQTGYQNAHRNEGKIKGRFPAVRFKNMACNDRAGGATQG